MFALEMIVSLSILIRALRQARYCYLCQMDFDLSSVSKLPRILNLIARHQEQVCYKNLDLVDDDDDDEDDDDDDLVGR